MTASVTALFRRMLSRFRREDGSATMEFVIVIPVLLTIFMASFESGMVMVRSILLEQSVDMTMREVRLGRFAAVSADSNKLADELKTKICDRTIVFTGCKESIMIEMTRISTSTWAMPAPPITCVDREIDAQPVLSLQIGQQNDVIIVRVCILQELLFPTTGIGLKMDAYPGGEVGLVAETVFVAEPT
ncbi:MAG: TadE/TadG family type IV pilus assembly protein [Paracoccaceae bacterium]